MANLPIPKVPNLSVQLRPAKDAESCEGTPEKASIENSDILVKFGQVKVTQTINLGYAVMGKPKWTLRATRAANSQVGFEFKYDNPRYLAGSIVQLHDYYAETPIVKVPQTTTRKVLIGQKGDQTKDVKVFNETPWEHFGKNSGRNFDFGDSIIFPGWTSIMGNIKDFRTYDPLAFNDRNNPSLRQHYLVEAHELITRLKLKEKSFKDYITNKKLEYLDLTNEMISLYSLAAVGQLPYDPVVRRYRIGNDANNPGFEREINIVFDLYFLTVRAECCSNTGSVFDDIQLESRPGFQALQSHKQKTCLKVIIVLNKNDTEDNEGVYYFAMPYGKGNPDATFHKTQFIDLASHGIDTGIAPSSGLAVDLKDRVKMNPPRNGISDGRFLKDAKMSENWVIIPDGLETIWSDKMVERTEYLRFWKIEELKAEAFAMGAYISNQKYVYQPFKRGQSFGVKMIPPSTKNKGPLGWEVLPGCKFWLTAGQNITNGDIPNMTLQSLFVLPFESFAVLTDTEQFGPTTLQTLPGKFWTMLGMGMFHVKLDMVQVINEGASIANYHLNILPKQKEAIRKMKEYVESMRAKYHQHVEELTKAYQNGDYAKYNQILNSLKGLAAEWAQRVGPNQDLTQALNQASAAGEQLKIYTDARNQLMNMPLPPGFTTPNGPALDPNSVLPQAPPGVSYEEVKAADPLVIPKDGSINPITNNAIDPVIFAPGGDSASGSSSGSLGNIFNFGNLGNVEDIPGASDLGDDRFGLPILDANHPNGNPPWYNPENY